LFLALLPLASASTCVFPGTCSPPDAGDYPFVGGRKYAVPRRQWGDSGGFCGALSIQVIGMSYGVYHSQDVIRKQAPVADPPGHGNPTEGYEILHSNVEGALQNLHFDYTSWDWENEPKPQGQAYLSWLKKQLVEGSGVVQFVLCKGDGHNSYGPLTDPVPYDHVEPFFKIYSRSPLNSTEVNADDIVVHGSDYSPDGEDNFGYFRSFDSLLDDKRMEGNCRDAGDGYGKNEMYPCLYNELTYGTSITGVSGSSADDVPVAILVNSTEEADIRENASPEPYEAKVIVDGDDASAKYSVFRFDGLDSFPSAGDDWDETASFVYTGLPSGTFTDPNNFLSNTSVMYRVRKEA